MARAQAALQRGTVSGGNIVHSTAVAKILQGPKTGKVHRRRGTIHRASAPGEAPASDTGQLAQAGTVEPLVGRNGTRVVFRKVYARALELGSAYRISGGSGADMVSGPDPAQREFGTQTLEPRPFLRPSLIENEALIFDTIVLELRAEFKSGGGTPAQLALL